MILCVWFEFDFFYMLKLGKVLVMASGESGGFGGCFLAF